MNKVQAFDEPHFRINKILMGNEHKAQLNQ